VISDKTGRAAMRCLKRRLVDVLYRTLSRDDDSADAGACAA